MHEFLGKLINDEACSLCLKSRKIIIGLDWHFSLCFHFRFDIDQMVAQSYLLKHVLICVNVIRSKEFLDLQKLLPTVLKHFCLV